MKKYLLMITLVFGGLYSYSQALDDIKKLILLQKYELAKPEIDKFLSDTKNAAKAEGWYYKAFVYSSLGRDTTKPVTQSKMLYQTAYDAIKKYTEVDPKVPLTIEEKNSTIFNVYYGFYDLGIKTYNKKNFSESFDLFKTVLEVHDYIYDKSLISANNLKFSAHDTDVVWNLVVLANELKNKEGALFYQKKIADADLSDEKYAGAYDELVLKYKREKNEPLFTKYLAAAKKHYPIDLPYWENQEIDFAIKDLENEALLNKYEELIKTLPTNYGLFYNYAVDIDRFINGSDTIKGTKLTNYRNKMEEMFKKAVSIKSTIEANLQLANMYYSRTYELQEQVAKIKGTKPEEVRQKNELNALTKSTMNASIPYAEEAVKLLAAMTEYKFTDKTNYKLALEILTNAYKMAGNAAKAAEYEKRKTEVDKL